MRCVRTSFGIPTLFAWGAVVSTAVLALLATAVLLAPGAAQARDECGTWSSSATSHTCSDAAYASGIRYDAADGWGNGIAGDITLTVTGGSATAISSAAAAASNSWGSGIVLRTAHHATDTRTVALTVGSGSNAVRITQTTGTLNAGFDNTGVVIHHRAAGASPTKVTLGSGVDIGTMAAPMKRSGVHVLVERADNTADHTVTSAADIYSAGFGILVDPRGSGNVVVTNSGSIVNAAVTGGTTGNADGIRILDWTGTRGNERPATATTTVTNSGSISVSQAGGSGIRVDAEGLGLYKTVNRGTVSATSTASHGIFVDATHHWGAAGSKAVEIENTGAITTAGTSTHGIYVETYDGGNPQGRGDGNLAITNSGSISSANAALLVNSNAGDTTVKHTGGSLTSTADDGIRVQQGGTGAVTVESGADVTAENYGIRVLGGPTQAATTVTVAVAVGVTTRTNEPQVTIAAGTTTTTYATLGDVSVTHSGGDIEAETESGIWIQQAGADATVTSSADITAEKYGIFVLNNPALATVAIAAGVTTRTWSNTGAVSVTHSAGNIAAETESGIHARNSAGNADAVTVAVTGGSVSTEGQSKAAVAVLQRGTGDAVASVSSGAMLTSKHNAGIYATLSHAANAAGQVKVTQAGTIAARKGVYARAGRFSAAGETREAAAGPVIDIIWTGSFSHGTTASVAQNDEGRFLPTSVAHAVAIAQEVETEKAIRYGTAAGIEAQVLSWRQVMTQVAGGDDPGVVTDAAAMLAGADGPAIRAAFKAVLANGDLDTIPGASAIDTDGTTGLSDAEIDTYLTANQAVLRNVLAQGFSEAEKAVLQAVVTNTGLDAALDDADADFSDNYKTAVKAFLNRYNVGDIRVAMNGGSIASRGDGIRAYYATPNNKNGAIDVTIAAGTTVTGANAGIYVANAGMGTDDILKQTVTVHGTVTGGMDAAVHLAGGGRLTVGAMGKVHAGSSGRAILVNDPGRSEVVIHGEVRGGAGAMAAVDATGGGSLTVGRTGMVSANGAESAIRSDHGTARVDGTVTGGAGTGAALHLTGGGSLTVSGTGMVSAAGAKSAIRSDLPVTARVDGTVRGGTGADAAVHLPGGGSVTVGLTGRVDANGAKSAIRGDEPTEVEVELDGALTPETLNAARARVVGPLAGPGIKGVRFLETRDGETTGGSVGIPVDEDGALDGGELDRLLSPGPDQRGRQPGGGLATFDCDDAKDRRCGLYEALPSVLLAMNGLPTYAERMASSRDAAGGWARVESTRGAWKAESSTRPGVAYDHSRYGVRAGVDVAVGEKGRLGFSLHGLRGSAEMDGGTGEATLTGMGLGVHGTALFGDGFHLDAQAGATWYDVDLSSSGNGALGDGVKGLGYALGVEVGRRMPVEGGVFVTPRVGLVLSEVGLSEFSDSVGNVRPRVSVEDARSMTGRAGVGVEAPVGPGVLLYGSLDAVHEFSEETSTSVSDALLTSSAASTSVRVGVGGAFVLDENTSLRAAADYTAGGSDTNAWGGSLNLAVRF